MSLFIHSEKCDFDVNYLEKVVYLVDASTPFWITYDDYHDYNHVDFQTSAVGVISGYNVSSISVEETSELNGRYSFSHQVNFTVKGYPNVNLIGDHKYHVILKKKDLNVFFLMNPTIPCKLEYTFTLGEEECHTDFTLETVSNEPLLNLSSGQTVPRITMVDNRCYGYYLDGIKKLSLGYASKAKRFNLNGFDRILAAEALFDMNAMMKGAVFTEHFDGETIYHTISFKTRMDKAFPPSYNFTYDLQYAMLQFLDSQSQGFTYTSVVTDNKLCALIESDRGEHYFVSNLIPNYVVNGGNDAYLSADITLNSTSNDSYLSYSLLNGFNDVNVDNTTQLVYVKTEFDPCDGNGRAMYLLKSRKDIFGNEGGDYRVKSGYRDLLEDYYFPIANYGEWTEEVYYESDKCAQYNGSTGGTLPSVINLPPSGGCSSYTFSASCDWNITTDFEDEITVNPMSGYAGELYTLSVCYVQTRWVASGYTCQGYDKYTLEVEQISYDGITWTNTGNQRQGSLIEADSEDCGYVPPTPPTIDGYLEFKSVTNSTYRFTNNVQYSTDSGTTWTTLTANTDTPTISANSTILWRGDITASLVDGVGTFSSSGQFEAYGNPLSLANSTSFDSASLVTHQFRNLFAGCSGLTSAEDLVLSATTLTPYCYASMFSGCTSLTKTPSLPSTTMEDWCYHSMFAECTSLQTAPILSATTLDAQCYEGMFRGCTSLTTAPSLPATTLAYSCYRSMFQGCTSLTTAPSLPATTLTESCYAVMFLNCTSLTTAPTLSAATVAPLGYMQMFQGCTSLNRVTCLATDVSAENATYWWLYNVASSGTFTKASSMTSWTSDASGIPSGWTVNNN